MLKKILIAVLALVAGLVIFASLQDPNYYIAREVTVQASPEAIFPWINNSKKTQEWMPWNEADPNVQMIYSGPDEGVGSVSRWDSKSDMGTGQALIVESVLNRSAKTELTFTKPMEMVQTAELTLTPAAQGTVVKWSVSGKNSLPGRIMCLFMNMDKVVGKEFEKGLGKLKLIVEKK